MRLDDMGLKIIHAGVGSIGVLVYLAQVPFLFMAAPPWTDRDRRR